jgi:uracil-DNA glycosylase
MHISPSADLPTVFIDALALAHPSWRPILLDGLRRVAAADPAYLPALAHDQYLPTENRLLAAFRLPLPRVRYVLVGEGPYPRAQSATGVCFMDGAVAQLWSETGLSKSVNRATSLRNFVKMLLVADGRLQGDATSGAALAPAVAAARAGGAIATMDQLQENLLDEGFLLLNAALVFRPHVAPPVEARAWQPFLRTVLAALAGSGAQLVLWGKIAEQLKALPEAQALGQLCAEHPYNLSFIVHPGMHALFGPMQLLRARGKNGG